jgi:hypothetical protein
LAPRGDVAKDHGRDFTKTANASLDVIVGLPLAFPKAHAVAAAIVAVWAAWRVSMLVGGDEWSVVTGWTIVIVRHGQPSTTSQSRSNIRDITAFSMCL